MPTARLEVENSTVRRGSETTVRVITEWTDASDTLVVLPVEYPSIEGTEWHDQRLASERDGHTNRVVQTASLRVLEAEQSVRIPEIAVKYMAHGDQEEEHQLLTDPVTLDVRPAVFGTPLAGGILAAAAVCAAVWLAVRMRRRQRPAEVGQPVSGAVGTLEQDLHSLRKLRLAGDYGAYFMGLIRIAREIDPSAVDEAPLRDVAALVESARYGGYRPDKELADRAYRACERLLKHAQSQQAAGEV